MTSHKSIFLLLILSIFTQIAYTQTKNESEELFNKINAERAKSGLSGYKTEKQLQDAADQRVKEIANGVRKSTALEDNNIQFSSYSESSIVADINVDEAFNQILNRQRNLILNNKFTHMAASVYEDNGKKYWVMLYVASRNNNITREELDINKESQRVVELCNEARKQNGVNSSLVLDAKLSTAAQKRAEELVQLFSHTRPNKTDFSTVLKEYNISYKTAGENIAYGQVDADDVMKSWLNSPGHRANILQKKFGKIGVGIFNHNNTLYWVQIFTD